MRIERLIIQDTKRIKKLELQFPPPLHEGTPREREPWTVIIGENGTCKTTILQVIALASAGREQMNLWPGRSLQDAAGLGRCGCGRLVGAKRCRARQELGASVGVPADQVSDRKSLARLTPDGGTGT
ncbi:MAG: hypothetical protein IPI35_14300 [Deltaproteobacteria bacterium]|nr:hypothetical protein [Deltaproteobacteria bacterium]